MVLLAIAVVALAAFVSVAKYSSATSEPAANYLAGERKGTVSPPKPASSFADWDALVDADSASLFPCGCFAFGRTDDGAVSGAVKPNRLNPDIFTKIDWSQ